MTNSIYIPFPQARELGVYNDKGDIVEVSYTTSDSSSDFKTTKVEVVDNTTVVGMFNYMYTTRLVIKIDEQYYISTLMYEHAYECIEDYDPSYFYDGITQDTLIEFKPAKVVQKTDYEVIKED